MMLPVSGLTSTCSMPGIRLKVCLISFNCSGLPLAPETFIRMRPGTWWAILILTFLARAGAAVVPASGMGGFGGRFRRWFGRVGFGVHLGDDVVHLLLGLRHHLARLLAELVGAAHRRAEHRGDGGSDLGHIFW